MRFYIHTFGCQMNTADSEEMGRHLKERGFATTLDPGGADAILVNTCTVRGLAEHKASSYVGRLKEWKEEAPERLIILAGCAAERNGHDFKKRFPYIDLVVGAKSIEEFPAILDAHLKKGLPQQAINDSPFDFPKIIPSKVVQYVTVMRGCNYNCTYCIVPSVRGREFYRPVEEILKEISMKACEGAKEIWLLGQTVNSYQPTNPPKAGYDFADLLEDVSKVEGIERIRFMSPHPFYLTERLMETMASCKKVCEHIHLPVQSGSNRVLRAMKRNYTRESYIKGVRELRRLIPHISITTDIIAGFCGETEADFKETLSLVEEAQFDSAYCFKYSPRPGTEAAGRPDDVPSDVKEKRVNELLDLTHRQSTAKAKGFLYTHQDVLIEENKGSGLFRGKTRGAWRVRLKNPSLNLGQILNVRITATHERELQGELAQKV